MLSVGTVNETAIELFTLGNIFGLTLRLGVGLTQMISECQGHTCDDLVGTGAFRIVYSEECSRGASTLGFECVIADMNEGFDLPVSKVLELIPKIDSRKPWAPAAIQQLLAVGCTRSTFLYENKPLVSLGSRRVDPSWSGFFYPILTFKEVVARGMMSPHIGSVFVGDTQTNLSFRLLLCRRVAPLSLPVS